MLGEFLLTLLFASMLLDDLNVLCSAALSDSLLLVFHATASPGNTVSLPCRTTPNDKVDWRYKIHEQAEDEEDSCNCRVLGGKVISQYITRMELNESAVGDHDLVIHDVSMNDTGFYRCLSGNDFTERSHIHLIVAVLVCASNPCQNNGICFEGNMYMCVCLDGFRGTTCEHSDLRNGIIWIIGVAALIMVFGLTLVMFFVIRHHSTTRRPQVKWTLSTSSLVHGMALIGNKLFVLCNGDKNQLKVYNTTDQHKLLQQMTLKGVTCDAEDASTFNDMAACSQYGCLYIYDHCRRSIFRFELLDDGKVGDSDAGEPWSVGESPCRLSVTADFYLLVTCTMTCTLKLFETDGTERFVIRLHSDIVSPHHAIQLPTGQFVVSHGGPCDDSVHRVCTVDTGGNITKSYGGKRGSSVAEFKLDGPFYLAISKAEYIFVADYFNNKVLLLSPTLGYLREVESRHGLNRPYRLCFDVDKMQLYVGQDQLGKQLALVQLCVKKARSSRPKCCRRGQTAAGKNVAV